MGGSAAAEVCSSISRSRSGATATIVIVSDGGDNRSHYTADQIESLVREADVQIYAMGVFDPVFSLRPRAGGDRSLSFIPDQLDAVYRGNKAGDILAGWLFSHGILLLAASLIGLLLLKWPYWWLCYVFLVIYFFGYFRFLRGLSTKVGPSISVWTRRTERLKRGRTLRSFVRSNREWLVYGGPVIIFVTFICKDVLRENYKDLSDSVTLAEAVFLIRDDVQTLKSDQQLSQPDQIQNESAYGLQIALRIKDTGMALSQISELQKAAERLQGD